MFHSIIHGILLKMHLKAIDVVIHVRELFGSENVLEGSSVIALESIS